METTAKPFGQTKPIYFTVAGAEALSFFRCEPHKATVSTKGCAGRWSEAQRLASSKPVRHVVGDDLGMADLAPQPRYDACRSCPLGAAHAGASHVKHSRFFQAAICSRCRRGSTRMIGGRFCPSCYNRNRELKVGRNARGNAPSELLIIRAPRPVEYRAEIDGVAMHVRTQGADLLEPVFQTLRTLRGAMTFGFQAPTAHLRQGRLF